MLKLTSLLVLLVATNAVFNDAIRVRKLVREARQRVPGPLGNRGRVPAGVQEREERETVQNIMQAHPVDFGDPKKMAIFNKYRETAMQETPTHIAQHRHALPPTLTWNEAQVKEQEGASFPYDNAQVFGANEVHWYANFATREAFSHYKEGTVQDQMQNLMVPVEAAVYLYIKSLQRAQNPKFSPLLLDDNNTPQPISLYGAKIYADIKLYGDGAWSRVTAQQLENPNPQQYSLIAEPRKINILAVFALPRARGHSGKAYQAQEIRIMLHMLLTGLRQIKEESQHHSQGQNVRVVYHTGGWGCGHFHNDFELITLLHLVAARATGVDMVIYTPGSPEVTEANHQAYLRANEKFLDLWPANSEKNTEELITAIKNLNIRWT